MKQNITINNVTYEVDYTLDMEDCTVYLDTVIPSPEDEVYEEIEYRLNVALLGY